MIEIKYVTSADRDFWYSMDAHLLESEFERKVRDRQGYVIFDGGIPKGILRYSLFWDNTPFCNMLYVEWNSQKKGYGRMLMEHWEKDIREQGFGMAMVSTRVDESAQHFYRKLGYKDCGGFTLELKGYEQPLELIMIKGLQE